MRRLRFAGLLLSLALVSAGLGYTLGQTECAANAVPRKVPALYDDWYANPAVGGQLEHWEKVGEAVWKIGSQTLWEQARVARPDWVLITSRNEWHEGSEIDRFVEGGDRARRITGAFAHELSLLPPRSH